MSNRINKKIKIWLKMIVLIFKQTHKMSIFFLNNRNRSGSPVFGCSYEEKHSSNKG